MASKTARCFGGKSPSSVNCISELPAGVVFTQRRLSQSVRVISDRRFVMTAMVTAAGHADHWTLVPFTIGAGEAAV